MSGFYLLALLGLWLLVGRFIYRVWRDWRPQKTYRKIVHVLIGLGLFSIWFGGAFWQVTGKKMYWDAQVRKLCAIDGGVKVYETVELTPDLIDWAGRISIPSRKDAKPSDQYYRESSTERLAHKGNLTMSRTVYKYIRRADGKVLGESIGYGRGGGDLYGPWESSYFLCPDPVKAVSTVELIFIEGDKK